jgi:hypothetical protein
LEDLDAVFALDFLEVDEDRLQGDRCCRGRRSRCETIGEGYFEAGSERPFVSLFAFSISSTVGSSFFKLLMESKAIFTLGRAWSTASLLKESEIDYSLVKRNGSQNKACNSTNIGVGISVRLTGLAMRVEGLFDGRG